MRTSIRGKILLLTVLPIGLIYVVLFGITMVQMQQHARRDIESHMTELAWRYAAEFDARLREVAQVAASTATFVETAPGITEEQIYAQLGANVSGNPLVYGAAMAFEPGRFEGRPLFCPYVFESGDGLSAIDIGAESYDYTDPEWEWWNTPRDTGEGRWTEPYLDEGAGNILMCTYAVPFAGDDGFGGVTTIDIPLAALNQQVGIADVRALDFVIVTRSGRYVFHRDPARIMTGSIVDEAQRSGRPDLADLAARMVRGESGLVRLESSAQEDSRWVFFAPITSTGWAFAAQISERAAMAPVRERMGWMVGVLVVSFAFIVASVWFVSGMIARPIREADTEAAVTARSGVHNRLKILGYSVVTMAVIASAVAAVTILSLYKTARDQQARTLEDAVRAQARLIEAVARFDRIHSEDAHVGGWAEATLQQVADAHRNHPGFGKTGELVLARIDEDDRVEFLLERRHLPGDSTAPTALSDARIAEPMRRALDGESGTLVGLDYRGAKVLAAYEPVSELDLGLVAKIDTSEIRAPFVKAAMFAGLVAVLLIVAGSMLVVGVNSPLIRRVEESESRLFELNRSLEEKVRKRTEEVLRGRSAVIFGLAKLTESRDDDTGKHLERICAYTEVLGQRVARDHDDVDEDWARTISTTAALHDVGKVGIPDAVLLKPGKLTDDERRVIQRHTTIGGDTLLAIKQQWGEDTFLATATQIAFAHHERWDGTGYPFGLSGVDIPLAARIVAVADVYDALTSKRVYKPAMSHEEAVAVIVQGAGTHFDPEIIAVFEDVQADFARIGRKLRRED